MFPERGTLRFYLDGQPQPAIEGGAPELLIGGALVGRPLSIENAHGPPGAPGGMNLYLPIPFAKHCKITWDGPNYWKTKDGRDMRWYNIEYRTYPPGAAVETFQRGDLARAKAAIDQVSRTLLNPPDFSGGKLIRLDARLGPGSERQVQLPSGPGAVRWMELRLAADNLAHALRQTILELEFDGERTVWCPAGDFFGSGLGLNPMNTWYRSVGPDGRMICRWVMPYERSGRLRLRNVSRQPVHAEWRGRVGDWDWDARSMHFHSTWHQEVLATRPRRDWNYVSIQGRGVYVGDTLALFNPVRAWWGEGDEKIWVDHEAFPSHFGTGSEDYYGYSYGNPTRFDGPFSAQPRCDGPGNQGHVTDTRTRNLDAIPFRDALKFDMEIWHWADTRVTYAVATYWYAKPGARSTPP